MDWEETDRSKPEGGKGIEQTNKKKEAAMPATVLTASSSIHKLKGDRCMDDRAEAEANDKEKHKTQPADIFA